MLLCDSLGASFMVTHLSLGTCVPSTCSALGTALMLPQLQHSFLHQSTPSSGKSEGVCDGRYSEGRETVLSSCTSPLSLGRERFPPEAPAAFASYAIVPWPLLCAREAGK